MWTRGAALILALAAVTVSAAPSSRFAPSSPSSSPSSPYTIAFASFSPLNADIFVASGDGRDAKPWLPSPAQDWNASFSRDGQWIVFTSTRNGSADVYRARPDGSGLERLTDDPAFDDQGALSPDGRRLAFVSTRSGHTDIWTLDLRTRALTRLTRDAGGNFRPAWSPDGTWIAFSSDRDAPGLRRPNGFETIQRTALYRLRSADGTDQQRLTTGDTFVGSPQFSADGTRLACYTASMPDVIAISDPRRLRATTQIAVVDIASGALRESTNGPGEKWSPRWLAADRIGYTSGGPDRGLEFTTGGAGPRGEFGRPDWSADGRRIVFRAQDERGKGLRILDVESRQVSVLTTGQGVNDNFPSWSPKGDEIAFASDREDRDWEIYTIRADGTGLRRVTRIPGNDAHPAWSPDGAWIAFATGQAAFRDEMALHPHNPQSYGDIAVIRGDGSDFRLLTDNPWEDATPRWAPAPAPAPAPSGSSR